MRVPAAGCSGYDQGAAQAFHQDQGMSSSQVIHQVQESNMVSLDSLMNAHVKFKQYYAIDFTRLASFN